jgi:hypothetical protein
MSSVAASLPASTHPGFKHLDDMPGATRTCHATITDLPAKYIKPSTRDSYASLCSQCLPGRSVRCLRYFAATKSRRPYLEVAELEILVFQCARQSSAKGASIISALGRLAGPRLSAWNDRSFKIEPFPRGVSLRCLPYSFRGRSWASSSDACGEKSILIARRVLRLASWGETCPSPKAWLRIRRVFPEFLTAIYSGRTDELGVMANVDRRIHRMSDPLDRCNDLILLATNQLALA